MKTATLVKKLTGFRGDARHFRLSEPIEDNYGDWHSDVIVSAAEVRYSGPETYMFPATADGEIAGWGELAGSFKGDLDHERALNGAGYEVTT